MLFNSLTFLVFFLVVFTVYWAVPWHRGRLAWLLGSSVAFYAAWYPIYILLFLAMTLLNYGLGLAVGNLRLTRPQPARAVLWLAAVINLGLLGLFKYYDFFLQNVAGLWNLLSHSHWSPPFAHLVLPLGISFYTFQLLGYVIDVHAGRTVAVRSLAKVALFKAFFPQLIAGPILRASQFLPQLSSKREFRADWLLHGLDLIAVGLFKKVLIADQVAPFVETVFAAPEGRGSLVLVLAVYSYSLQIYCDFSGYTDIGRGCAYCLGYELPVNFRHPYFSTNIAEFWRRWHITLSNWLRDYLYIGLGGNRGGPWRTYRNLLLTMTLGGLWHGASWNFVIWGLLHGGALSVTRFFQERKGRTDPSPPNRGKIGRLLAIVGTFHLVCLGWIFFRAATFDQAISVIRGIARFRLFGNGDLTIIGWITIGSSAAVFVAAAALHFLSLRAIDARFHLTHRWAVLRPFAYAVVAVGILLFATSGATQFIYFQF